MTELAVLVEKSRVEAAIEALRSEGVYDATRRIRERDGETLELPVTVAPSGTDAEVVEQRDPTPRLAGLDDHLAARGWTDAELALAPTSWAVVGDVVLVKLPEDCPRPAEVGEALAQLQGAETVLARRGIEGPHREPRVDVLAGSGDTETVHVEAGTEYAVDLARVMFSPGNRSERVRAGRVVEPDERVLDMFAGIGYFALPMARSGARVTAVERNPVAFSYLVENGRRNGVDDRLTPILGDCREVASIRARTDDIAFERVVMGHFEAVAYVDAAVSVLAPRGIIHLHATVPEADPIGQLEDAAAAVDRSVTVLDRRLVKGYAPGVDHVVVDARVD